MSNILRINKSGKLNVKVKGVDGGAFTASENTEDVMQLQLHNAYEKGFSEGYRKALNELEKKYETSLQLKYEELGNLMNSVDEKIVKYDATFDNTVCEFAFAIAEKIVREKIEKHPSVNQVLNESMKKVIGANNVIIKLNEADLNNLNSESKGILNDASYSKIKFEADNNIETGGCLIETDIGNVDARISTQLKELKKIIAQKVLVKGSDDVD